MKKFLCVLLAVILAVSLIQGAVYAYNMPRAYGNGNNRTDPNGPEILPMVTDPDRMATVAPDMNNGTWTFNRNKLFGRPDQGDLPALGWNSWNAFQKNINEDLIKSIADSFIRLGLDEVGYEYLVIDDGCYADSLAWPLTNHSTRFASGFKAMSDYVHDKGLKYGMYQNSAYRTCGGQTGTYGYEDEVAEMMVNWGVDYIKYDFCSNPWNVNKVLVGPNVRNIRVTGGEDFSYTVNPADSPRPDNVTFVGTTVRDNAGYLTGIGYTSGDNGYQLARIPGEVLIDVTVPADGVYDIEIENSAASASVGRTFQLDVNGKRVYETIVPSTGNVGTFQWTKAEGIALQAGVNKIRIYNLKGMESALESFAAFKESLISKGGEDIKYSICEWGGNMPSTWAFKVGDSYRITSDIANKVHEGQYSWMKFQYDRAVILDKYTGLDTAWADADMMVVGLKDTDKPLVDGVRPNFTHEEDIQHFTMWSMMNSPIMLGLDLTKVEVGDPVHQVITNSDVIALNQDPLGIQAKRIKMSIGGKVESFTTSSRTDILAKPLSDGAVAVMFTNVAAATNRTTMTLTMDEVLNGIGDKMVDRDKFASADYYLLTDLWTKEVTQLERNAVLTETVAGHDSKTYRITAVPAQAEITAPESVIRNELFQVTITTPFDITKLRLKNEPGNSVGSTILSKIDNGDGTFTTVLQTSVGTLGIGRILTVFNGNERIGSFTFDSVKPPEGIVSVIAPEVGVANKEFEVTVTTTKDLIKGKFYNEKGGVLGSAKISNSVVGDYRVITYVLAVGTAGDLRTITFKADFDKKSDFPYAEDFQMTILEKCPCDTE